MTSILITGASTGIGRACAERFARAGWRVYGTVRRQEDSERLSATLGERFTPLLVDVTRDEEVRRAAALVKEKLEGRPLSVLVNNAGIGLGGPVFHMPLDDYRKVFEVNILGVVRCTQAFGPLLKAENGHPAGRIIQMGSVSGKIAIPFLSAYSASKHALEAISDSLRRELIIYGIDVIVIEPGSIKTPIWDKAADSDFAQYDGTEYAPLLRAFQSKVIESGRHGRPVEDVAECVFRAATTPRPKTRYALPNQWLQGWLLPRWLPDRVVDRLLAKRLGFE